MAWKMVRTPFFTQVTEATTHSDYIIDICEGCEWLNDGCDGEFDQRESCEFDHRTTIDMMQEENADYKKRNELRLARQRSEQQEKESAKFYTENPDFLEV